MSSSTIESTTSVPDVYKVPYGVISSSEDYRDYESEPTMGETRSESVTANPDSCTYDFKKIFEQSVPPRPTLVLDLDETVVHCVQTANKLLIAELITMPNMLVTFKHLSGDLYIVFHRPHVVEFLTNMSIYYDIVVYTNGSAPYCDTIIFHLTQLCGRQVFKQAFSRRDEYAPLYKKLESIGVSHEVAVVYDDRLDVWISNIDNLVIAKQFLGPVDGDYMKDTTLSDIQQHFITLYHMYITHDVKDIKLHIPKIFKFIVADSQSYV